MNYTQTLSAYKNLVNQQVASKVAEDSIDPTDVGSIGTQLADLLLPILNKINDFATTAGTGNPSNADGGDLDVYIKTGPTIGFYKKRNGVWNLEASIPIINDAADSSAVLTWSVDKVKEYISEQISANVISTETIAYADLEPDHKTYINESLAGKTYDLFLNSIGRFLNPDEFTIEPDGGFVLTYELNDGDFLKLIGQVSGSSSQALDMAQAALAMALGAGSGQLVAAELIEYEVNIPANYFKVNNNINPNRQVVSAIYPDNLLAYYNPVHLNNGYEPVYLRNPLASLTLSASGYSTKSVAVTVRTANASKWINKQIGLMIIGDSKSAGNILNRYGQQEHVWSSGSQFQSNVIKDGIDNGGSVPRPVLIGRSGDYYTRTGTYKTANDITTKGGVEAIGGRCVANYLRHAMALFGQTYSNPSGQICYHLLGLQTLTGQAYADSQTTRDLIRTTVQGKNPPDYNSVVWDYLKARPGWAGGSGAWVDNPTNRGYIDSWLLAKYNNPDIPFYSYTKAQTPGSTDAFDFDVYLNRYRTLQDDMVTRCVVGVDAGSLVTNANAYDVCTPTDIIIEMGENDKGQFGASFTSIGNDILLLANLVHASKPAIRIGIMNFPNQGALFPENYKRVVHSPRNNNGNYPLFNLDKYIQTSVGSYATQQANKLYYVPLFSCNIPYSNVGDTAGYDGIGELLINGDNTDNNNAIHPGLISLKSAGDVIYNYLTNII